MACFTEKDLMRDGGWSRFRRCFDVGQYHINVYLFAESRRFHVRVWRGPREVYEAMTPPLDGFRTPVTKDFVEAAMAVVEAAAQKMLIDQPSLAQEALHTPGGVLPMSIFMNAPC